MFSRMGFFSFGEEERKANFRNLTVPPNFRFKGKKEKRKKKRRLAFEFSFGEMPSL